MAAKKISEKHQAMAYVLNKEFNYSMSKIGELMGVSQSTISNGIKDFKYRLKIENLENELIDARRFLVNQGYELPVVELN